MVSDFITIYVTDSFGCPLYTKGERFRLWENAVLPPENKPACLALVADLYNRQADIRHHASGQQPFVMTCSGCTGSLSLSGSAPASPPDSAEQERVLKNIAGILSNFSIFKSLDESQVKDVISSIKLQQYATDKFILTKGKPVHRLFIVLSGTVEVIGEGNIQIATLKKGDVFGEMSLLSGGPAVASVKSTGPAKVLYFSTADFRKLIKRFPSLQMYLARLLTERLAKTNLARSKDFGSGMHGNLVDTPIAELCQIINMNRKSGVLTLNLSKATARISFRDGNIITATYGAKQDKDAFFSILKDTQGIFKFSSVLPTEEKNKPAMANFMNLLLEGISRLDDERLIT